MSTHFLNGFVHELVKEADDSAVTLPKLKAKTMEIKPPKPPKPLEGQKPQTMEMPSSIKTANLVSKAVSGASALKSQLKRMLSKGGDAGATMKMRADPQATRKMLAMTGPAKHRAGEAAKKVKGKAQDLMDKAKGFASKQGKKWKALSPSEQKRYMAMAGAGAAAGTIGGIVQSKLAAEDKAGAMVKEVVENAKGKRRIDGDVGDSMVDQYGGGLGNFEGKTAPKFTDKINPTDTPGAFGKAATGQAPSARFRAGANSLSPTELRVLQQAAGARAGR
jgi:uncharacterized protein YjbJ (UPF0337 family)